MSTSNRSDGYALLVGGPENERQQAEAALRLGGLVVASATFDELLALPDVAPPTLVVLDGPGTREQRRQHQDRLRRHPRLRDVPLLVLGEEDDRASFALAIAHGASAYLAKPVSGDVLASVARKLCDFRGAPVPEDKRRHPRRPLLVPIEIETWTRPERALGWMLDASCAGCRIETPEAPAKGDAVQVWLPVAEATANTPLLGRACWTRTVDPGRALAGIRFNETASLLAGLALGLEPGGSAN